MAEQTLGTRVRAARTAHGLSLSELARRAGIGKATLSQIEADKRNPTIETLYALCEPLRVPLTTLTGQSTHRAAGGMMSVPLDIQHIDGETVETFRLEFPVGAQHDSPSHGARVTEHLYVVSGSVRIKVGSRSTTVAAGRSHTWESDRPHGYAAVNGTATAVLVITSPSSARQPQVFGVD